MKKLSLLVLTALLVTGCSHKEANKAQEKKVLDSLLEIHNIAMDHSEAVLDNKIKLDSVAKLPVSPATRDSALKISKDMTAADDAMEIWMHKFEPDNTGRSHQETMQYLHSQHIMILKIDSQLKAAIDESNHYLIKFNPNSK